MNHIQIDSAKTLKKIISKKRFLEKKLKVKLLINGKSITIEGEEIDKYFAYKILEAINLGFQIETALLLLNENYVFEIVNIKQLSKRTDISQIRARIIGRKGRTLQVISELTNCEIILRDNEVYIIGPSEKIKDALNGLKKLILGSKQSSTYSYLERQRKAVPPPDWGLKIKK